jgi:D-arabinose 1-dehydrogenase-like Zn-dependent alcohol dehydrogenase
MTNIPLLFWKQIQIIGSTMGTADEFAAVMRLVWQGKLRPVVDRVLPLEQIKEAHEALEAGEQFGKIVLKP